MTRYEVFIEKSWRENGLGYLVVARIRGEGHAEIGSFLVDCCCLGVKDAFLLEESSSEEFDELVGQRLPEEFRERIHPACAKKLIEGALTYAQSLGFAPHRDFRKARRVLSGINAADCPETFSYGRDGRPFFMPGPDDSEERVARVLAILKARCGPDGFGYEPYSEDDDDFDEEDDIEEVREDLKVFLDLEPDHVPGFQEFSGILTALHVCPNLVPPTRVLETLWGSQGRTWDDAEEMQGFATKLGLYWNYVANLLAEAATPGSPPGNPIDVSADEYADRTEALGAVVAWSHGFMRATTLWPEAWGDALKRDDVAGPWAVVRAWADPGAHEEFLTQLNSQPESPASRLPLAIVELYRKLRPQAPAGG